MNTILRIGIVCLIGLLALSGCGVSTHDKERVELLNHRAFDIRYTNPDSMAFYARLALEASDGYSTGKSEAYNHLAMAALMKQDFPTAERYYDLSMKSSNNQLEHLFSNVGMMRLCQRTASNKRFYDYYNKASRSIARLKEEIEVLDEHDRGRLTVAVSDFHLAASTYFYYMQQDDRAKSELMQLNLGDVAQSDSIQWVYGLYVWGTSGLIQEDNFQASVLKEFDDLLRALYVSKLKSAIYLEANIIQTFSELMSDSLWLDVVRRERTSEISFLLPREVPDSLAPIRLSEDALNLFQQYGDYYQVAGAKRSLAELLFYQGQYEEALGYLGSALEEINAYARRFDPQMAKECKLELFSEKDSLAAEMQMLEDYPLRIVPQWLANIRESISMTYSALGDKTASDYNRNIYLDILDKTRQDKELESRYEQLEKENAFVGILLIIVLIILIVGTIGFFYLNRVWRRKNEATITRLERVAGLCNRIVEGITEEESRVEVEQLEQQDPSLRALIQPYQDWSSQFATTLSDLEEEHVILEKEKYLHTQHVSDYKRQNLEKRTCMSIVYGITPFLDRMINEVRKLEQDEEEQVRQNRYIYIRELADRINEYNDILALWIKMKQGTQSLHIENFALNELFDTLAKGRRAFDQKQLQFQVHPTDAYVKADKALTMFFINTLAENARKYTSEGGRVNVFAEQTPDYVEISVEDTGCGLSETDIKRILEEKVYDSSQIGMQEGSSEAHVQLKQNKGFGFGLMNCKGIIDKYRKTNALFSVCKFGIESQLGVGCRFYFRLPKGVVRFGMLILLMLNGLCAWSQTSAQFLDEASRFADSTYYSNVDGRYEEALAYADTACLYLNRYYRQQYPGGQKLMSMTAVDGLAELEWWENHVVTDYHIILDIRNEVAVASLAMGLWDCYKLNNNGYTRLYKLLGEDDTLESFCQSSQKAASNRILAIWLIVVLMVVFLGAYYMLYFRHAQIYRMNMEQALLANRKILNLKQMEDAKKVLNEIYPDLNDIHPVKGLALLIDDRNKHSYPVVTTQEIQVTPLLESLLHKSVETQQVQEEKNSGTLILPLQVNTADELYGVGAIAFVQPSSAYSSQDELLCGFILRYLAIMIYQTLIRLSMKQSDVELAEDEKRRVVFEENQLHVQNQMLDNCLSALKHETMYYPNRIRQMVEELKKHAGKSTEKELILDMKELMDYYKEVFTLLSSCASRQVVNARFSRGKVSVQNLFSGMEKYFAKRAKKSGNNLTLKCSCEDDCILVGDEYLLRFLMESLVDAVVESDCQCESTEICISARAEGDFVRIELVDPRGRYTQEYLNALFYPDLKRMKADENGILKGTYYLVARQIIRDHEELSNHRGCRINAEVGEEGKGYKLWFTMRNK